MCCTYRALSGEIAVQGRSMDRGTKLSLRSEGAPRQSKRLRQPSRRLQPLGGGRQLGTQTHTSGSPESVSDSEPSARHDHGAREPTAGVQTVRLGGM